MSPFRWVAALALISITFTYGSPAHAQVRIAPAEQVFTADEGPAFVPPAGQPPATVQPGMWDDADEIFVSTEALMAAAAGPDPQAAAAAAAAAALKKRQAALKKQVAGAYAPMFYNNDFNYLYNPLYQDHYLGEAFKRRTIGDRWVYDMGGQYRIRFQDESNIRGAGLTGKDDEFYLQRERLFVNMQYGDTFRIFAEGINATSNDQFYAPRPIEVEKWNFLNLFADAKVLNGDNGDMTARVGRQELLYGSQRLISPLDWANTRRTFQGAKLFWQGENWNVDTFVTNPVINSSDGSATADTRQTFAAMWATYKAIENQTIDLYTIQYSDLHSPTDFSYTTMGGRYTGAKEGWLWEFEGGVQCGQNTNGSDHSAGFFTGGLGYRLDEWVWKPTLWGYYDWASGSDDRGAGNGFNQLFPFGHNFLGFMDLYGRSNIQSPNVQLSMKPREKLTVLLWYYYFMLENIHDCPYNVNGTAFNPTHAPAARDLGQEIDLTFNYFINPRTNVLIGASEFFAGQYYKLTPGVPYRDNASFLYTQFQVNF